MGGTNDLPVVVVAVLLEALVGIVMVIALAMTLVVLVDDEVLLLDKRFHHRWDDE